MTVEPRQALLAANELELAGILELHVLGNRQLAGGSRQLAKSCLLPGLVRDHALADSELRRRYFPTIRSRLDQHRTGIGARVPKLVPGVGHRGRAAGALYVTFRPKGKVAV